MSNVFQPKRKELAKVKVVTSNFYDENKRKYKYVGSVNRGFTNFITTRKNKETGQCSFIDDASSLTKRTKNDLTRFFSLKCNNGKQVAYLVVEKTTDKKMLAPRHKGKR